MLELSLEVKGGPWKVWCQEKVLERESIRRSVGIWHSGVKQEHLLRNGEPKISELPCTAPSDEDGSQSVSARPWCKRS